MNVPYSVLNPFLIHNHSEMSNFRLKDAVNKIGKMIDYAHKIGLSGIALTDHETLSGHVQAIQYVKEQKKKGKLPENFTLALGNEIYLVDREDTLTKKEANERITFYHFLLVAKNKTGYQALKELSSLAWGNSFFYRGMERVPTYKDDFERILKPVKGSIVASTACLGSEFSRNVVAYAQGDQMAKGRIHQLLTWLMDIFGSEIYIELQPANISEEQILYNKMAHKIAKAYKLKPIVTTDAHYLNKEQARVHEIYLKSNDGEREVAEFYSTTYLMDYYELKSFFPYFSEDDFHELINNTLEIREKIEEFDLAMETQIPKPTIPQFEQRHMFKNWYDKYDYIRRYAYSSNIEDRYFLHLAEEGFLAKKQDLFDEVNIARINTEIEELWAISENLNQPLSSYYLITKEVIDLAWEVSLVGVSRGSSSGFYTLYLLDIVQMNPIKFDLPHWRHITKERPELPDVDWDSEGAQRGKILELIKAKYGDENVLNICTFTTEKTKSAVLSACRGLGIDNDIAQGIGSLIPSERGQLWSFADCMYGNEELNRKPVKAFIEEIERYEGLKETIESIEGLVSGRSVHASGIYIFNNGYNYQNAMMKTTKGNPVTQFNMADSDYQGGLKIDALTINALDRIRKCMDLLLEYGKIEWQGSLRATYNKYLHPDVMELDNPEMFKLLYSGELFNAFQFETNVGQQALGKIKPTNFYEVATANSLMRLAADHGESPLDKYARHKENIQDWYAEMEKQGLNKKQMEVLNNHLSLTYGICDTQEAMMKLSMDPAISNFDLVQANKLRKGISKKKREIIEDARQMFYSNNENAPVELLDYVWEYLFKPSFGYSFSLNHTAPYSMILMQELNMAYKYGVIWWKTACLSVNAGVVGEETGSTNYGAVAKAVGEMKGVVINPDINTSKLEFTPIESENKVMFGLKPISGLGSNAIQAIMEHRPFASLEDFVERMVKEKHISDAKAVTLIKAGAFDKLCGIKSPKERRGLMVQFGRLINYVESNHPKSAVD